MAVKTLKVAISMGLGSGRGDGSLGGGVIIRALRVSQDVQAVASSIFSTARRTGAMFAQHQLLALSNGWVNHGDPHGPARASVVHGVVFLCGVVKNGSPSPRTIATF